MSIIDHAKEISELVKKYNDIDLLRKISDLSYEIFDLRDENLKLKQELAEFEQGTDLQSKIEKRGNQIYLRQQGGPEGPYCMTCWEADRKLIHLHYYESSRDYGCEVCNLKQIQKS